MILHVNGKAFGLSGLMTTFSSAFFCLCSVNNCYTFCMTYNIRQNCIVDLYNCTSNVRVSLHFNIQFLFIIEHCKVYDSWICFHFSRIEHCRLLYSTSYFSSLNIVIYDFQHPTAIQSQTVWAGSTINQFSPSRVESD